MEALLVLEDGFWLKGRSFTGKGEAGGEVVFTTAMVGYQEALTDPSYHGQILSFTYPHIGNYGICPGEHESPKPHPPAVLMKECCFNPSHRRAQESLPLYLQKHGVLGIDGIDTRTLTLHLRKHGTRRGIVSTECSNPSQLQEKMNSFSGVEGVDLARQVSTPQTYIWDNKQSEPIPFSSLPNFDTSSSAHVVVIDLGVKYGILRSLAQQGCLITVVPSHTPAEDIQALEPQGILLSNGPGDPAPLDYLIPTIKKLTGKYPFMGICLGHQLLARLLGIETFKLPFGHRGINHPVKAEKTEQVLITTQNHGFCLRADQEYPANTFITHRSLFDGTVEGIENPDWALFSVQYHPEASPGPLDSENLFQSFCQKLDNP